MDIVVCVKPVPDVSIISLVSGGHSIDSDDLIYIINPADMVAMGLALRMKERNNIDYVTVISMSPPSTQRLLRRCSAIGADEVIQVWDSGLDNLDSYGTAIVLTKAISFLKYDLILCGNKADDTESGQVGYLIADMLNVPLVSRVVNAEVLSNKKEVNVESKMERGVRQQVDITLPALLNVDASPNEPRYAGLPSLIASLRKNIKEYGLKELGLSYEEVGLKVLRTRVVATSRPESRPKKLFTPDSSLSAFERIRLVMSGSVPRKKSNLFEGSPEELSSKFEEFLNRINFWKSKSDLFP